MPKRHAHHLAGPSRWLPTLRTSVIAAMTGAWRRLRRWRQPLPVEVLISDRTRRRVLERELRWALGRLRRGLGGPIPPELSVLVQQVIRTDRQLAGCYVLGQRADGSRFALVRLALQVDGHRLSTDELLAVLAEQLVGLATQQSSSVLVPIDLAPAPAPASRTATVLPPDPLAPGANGTIGGTHAA